MTRIRTSLAALQIKNIMNANEKSLAKSARRLSSGTKIGSAGDDASGYAISEKMKVMLRSLNQCDDNQKEGMNLTATASGGLENICDILSTVKALVINSANETNSKSDREIMQNELEQLLQEIDNTAVSTEIFGLYPLNWQAGSSKPRAGYASELGDVLLSERHEYYPGSNQEGTGGGLIIYRKGAATGGNNNYLLSTDIFGIDIRVRDENGNQVLDMNLKNSTDPHLTKQKFGDKYIYQYDNGDTKFSVYQSYELIKDEDSAEGGEYYSLKYNIVNEGTKALGFDFSIMADPVYGNINGMPTFNGANVTAPGREVLGGNDGKIIFNSAESDGSICQVTGQLTGKYIENQPDSVVMNYLAQNWTNDRPDHIDWGMLAGTNAVTSLDQRFEHYTVGWLGKTLPPGSSFMANTLVGLSYPLDRIGGGDGIGAWIQSGTRSNQGLYVPMCDATVEGLGLEDIRINTSKQAIGLLSYEDTLGKIDKAIDKVLNYNTVFGSCQMRMEYGCANTTTQVENVQSAESVIRDANMAKEMTLYTRQQILLQASQSMMAQANQTTQGVLALLNV